MNNNSSGQIPKLEDDWSFCSQPSVSVGVDVVGVEGGWGGRAKI